MVPEVRLGSWITLLLWAATSCSPSPSPVPPGPAAQRALRTARPWREQGPVSVLRTIRVKLHRAGLHGSVHGWCWHGRVKVRCAGGGQSFRPYSVRKPPSNACTWTCTDIELGPPPPLCSPPASRAGKAEGKQKERGLAGLGAERASCTWMRVWGSPLVPSQGGYAGGCGRASSPRSLCGGGRGSRWAGRLSEDVSVYSISCCCCMASLTTSPSRVSMVLIVTVFLV